LKPTIEGGPHEVKGPKAAWVLWPCQKLPYWVEITDLSSIVEDHIELPAKRGFRHVLCLTLAPLMGAL
jgi:hypothetical protein